MSYRQRIQFVLVVLFPALVISAGSAEASAPAQSGGPRIKHFFTHAYCHVFPCKEHKSAQPPEQAKGEKPKPDGSSESANTQVATNTVGSPTPAEPVKAAPPTVSTVGKESTAATASTHEDKEQLLIPGQKVIVLKPGDKLPERKQPEYEDWSTPYLPRTMKGDIYLLGKIETSKFTRELVHVQWRELDPIDLWVVRPRGVQKPAPILYIYGFPKTNNYRDDLVCEELTKDGYAAIGFATALTAERIHDRPGREWFVSQFQESLGTSVHDVQMILNYLGSRGDLDMSRVGVWGVGSGASIAIMAGAVDRRIKALDLLNPWGDWPNWLAKSAIIPEKERSGFIDPRFLQTVSDLDPLNYLPELKDRNVRLQYIVDGITVTPPEVRKRMEAAAPPNVEVVQYQDAKEFADKVDSSGRRFDWIRQHLGALGEEREAGALPNQETTKASSAKEAERLPR